MVTVASWLTYPVVYIFPMIDFNGAQAVVAIQIGYGNNVANYRVHHAEFRWGEEDRVWSADPLKGRHAASCVACRTGLVQWPSLQ